MLKSDLTLRLVTAGVALPVLIAALFCGSPWPLVMIVVVAVWGGLWEFDRLLRHRGFRPFGWISALTAAALFFDVVHMTGRFAPMWPLALVIALMALLARRGESPDEVPAMALSLLGAAYLGTLGGTIATLRTLHPSQEGPWRLVLLLATIMAADTCAYFTGRAIGRHKLAPAISPSKTIEGCAGSLLGGAVASLAVARFTPLKIDPAVALILGVVVTLAGTAGDLVESLLKRWAGVKDSGAFFPGHGGWLDRIDSLLLGAPVLYYYFLCCR